MAWTRRLVSGKYAGYYRDIDGKQRTAPGGPFSHKPRALRAAADAEEGARAPGWRSPDASRATWGTWCAAWWPTRAVEASTLINDASRRDLHLMPRWGDVPLVDITRHDVKAWAAQLRLGDGRPRSPATVQRIVHLLSASLAAAVDAEILTTNPAARLRLGGGQASVERFVTREEFEAACEHLEGPDLVMARLLAGTGMRWGEAAGLHWARVDLDRGVVEVSDVWSEKDRAMKPYPKGRKRRHVPLPDWVDLGEPTAGPCGYTHPGCRSGLVVTTDAGAIAGDSNFRKAWTRAASAAGIGHVRVHDLRHSYASWLLQAGVSLAEVGRLLGHVSPITTQRYAHLAEMPVDAVHAALGSTPRERARSADVQQPDHQRRFTVINGGQSASAGKPV